MRLRVLLITFTIPLALWAALPLFSNATGGGAPADPSKKAQKLDSELGKVRAAIAKKRSREHQVNSSVVLYQKKINQLQLKISSLQQRESTVQADLNVQQKKLDKTQNSLRTVRGKIIKLRAKLVRDRALLKQRLRELYMAGNPDIMTVLLNADGFQQLLEQSEVISRISAQDRRIITSVRDAKSEADQNERSLTTLEQQQRKVTERIQTKRDEIANVKNAIDRTQAGYERVHSRKKAILNSIKTGRHELEDHAESLEKEQAKVREILRRAAGGMSAGPIKKGSGPFIWPITGPITGDFGEQRPGHIHAGIDISAPIGTPIRAAASGKVVLLGPNGGYGNYTCIQHSRSESSCYAHQSQFNTKLGASVVQGQVIGEVGNTGHSTGPHLHFEVRVNGNPVQPLNYL